MLIGNVNNPKIISGIFIINNNVPTFGNAHMNINRNKKETNNAKIIINVQKQDSITFISANFIISYSIYCPRASLSNLFNNCGSAFP